MTTMSPRLEKAALVAHVSVSVGWLGAVVAFLALAVAGLASADDGRARAAYLAMDVTAWFVILPLALASLATGLVQSLGTRWGLFRHYWVVTKLVVTVLSTLLLLVHLRPVGHLAEVAAAGGASLDGEVPARVQMVAASALAAVALLLATALSVLKPKGLTRHGLRKLREIRGAPPP